LGAELPGDAEAFVDGGVRLADVGAGSMAEAAGLRGGDLIVAIAGVAVNDLASLGAALRAAGATEPGTTAEIELVRDGQRRSAAAAVVRQPYEALAGVVYGELAVDGARLRTIATDVGESRGVIAVIQGIACESIDFADATDVPLAGLIAGWAAAGWDSFRFDKRGVGDSDGGPCRDCGFEVELDDARRALAQAGELARARGVPLFVFGHSVGGIVTALLAAECGAAGVMVYGTPVMRWLACLKDSVERQLRLRGASEDELAERVAKLDELASVGELNGRSAAYHRELDRVDIEAAWRRVTAPTLVLRGEHDWVVRDDDQARIAELSGGTTTIVDLPGLDHLFGWHADRAASLRDYGVGAFDPAIVERTLAWLRAHT